MPSIFSFCSINRYTVLGGAITLAGIGLAIGGHFKGGSTGNALELAGIITAPVVLVCTCLERCVDARQQRKKERAQAARDDAQDTNLAVLNGQMNDIKNRPVPSTQIIAAQDAYVTKDGKVEQKDIRVSSDNGASIIGAKGGTIVGTVCQEKIRVGKLSSDKQNDQEQENSSEKDLLTEVNLT